MNSKPLRSFRDQTGLFQFSLTYTPFVAYGSFPVVKRSAAQLQRGNPSGSQSNVMRCNKPIEQNIPTSPFDGTLNDTSFLAPPA
eukprot:5675707-Amphidinium_carterae.2